VASAVPLHGLIDLHNYATVRLARERVALDVTFPVTSWDGESPMEVACGRGKDQPAGQDLMAEKELLVATYCDRTKRDPFIDALSAPLGTVR
jgi:hypothetical protein